MAAPVIVLSGPSGAGKTTVGRLVAASFEPSAHVQMDDLAALIATGWIDQWLPASARQNHVIGGAAAATALSFAEGGYTVVLDGHVFPDGLDGLARAGARRGVPLHYAVLRADLTTCLARVAQRRPPDTDGLRGRQDARFAGIEPQEANALLADLHARFAHLGTYEANVIDASGPPDHVAATLLSAFEAGRLAVGPGAGHTNAVGTDDHLLDVVRRRMASACILSREDLDLAVLWAKSPDTGTSALGRVMVTDHLLRLVLSIAKQEASPTVPVARLVRVGLRGLAQAIERFDPEKGYSMPAYAAWWIRQAIRRDGDDEPQL